MPRQIRTYWMLMSKPMTMKHLHELPHINTFTFLCIHIQFWPIFFCCLFEAFLSLLFFAFSFSLREVFLDRYDSYVICVLWLWYQFCPRFLWYCIIFAHKYHRIATDEIEYGDQQAVFIYLVHWLHCFGSNVIFIGCVCADGMTFTCCTLYTMFTEHPQISFRFY